MSAFDDSLNRAVVIASGNRVTIWGNPRCANQAMPAESRRAEGHVRDLSEIQQRRVAGDKNIHIVASAHAMMGMSSGSETRINTLAATVWTCSNVSGRRQNQFAKVKAMVRNKQIVAIAPT